MNGFHSFLIDRVTNYATINIVFHEQDFGSMERENAGILF